MPRLLCSASGEVAEASVLELSRPAVGQFVGHLSPNADTELERSGLRRPDERRTDEVEYM